jgi:hypothetical protein
MVCSLTLQYVTFEASGENIKAAGLLLYKSAHLCWHFWPSTSSTVHFGHIATEPPWVPRWLCSSLLPARPRSSTLMVSCACRC